MEGAGEGQAAAPDHGQAAVLLDLIHRLIVRPALDQPPLIVDGQVAVHHHGCKDDLLHLHRRVSLLLLVGSLVLAQLLGAAVGAALGPGEGDHLHELGPRGRRGARLLGLLEVVVVQVVVKVVEEERRLALLGHAAGVEHLPRRRLLQQSAHPLRYRVIVAPLQVILLRSAQCS